MSRYRPICLLLAVGCTPLPPSSCEEDNRFDMTISGASFGDYEELLVRYRLVGEVDGRVKESGGIEVIDGEWEVYESCGLERGHEYFFHLFVDLDIDARCEAGEPGWIIDIPRPVQDFDETLKASEATEDSDEVCEPF